MAEDSREILELRPRPTYHRAIFADHEESPMDIDTFRITIDREVFACAPNRDKVVWPHARLICQCCRARTVEQIIDYHEHRHVEDYRKQDPIDAMLIDTYIDTGCTNIDGLWSTLQGLKWVRALPGHAEIREAEYAGARSDQAKLQKIDEYTFVNTDSFSEAERSFGDASSKLKRYVLLEHFSLTNVLKRLAKERIMNGDWVHALEPARPVRIRAEHPAKCSPILGGRPWCVTWVSDASICEWDPDPTVKVMPGRLAPPTFFLRRKVLETYEAVMGELLLQPMANVVASIVAKKNARPDPSKVLRALASDMERVIKFLRDERYWKNPTTRRWYPQIPLVPTSTRGLPQSTKETLRSVRSRRFYITFRRLIRVTPQLWLKACAPYFMDCACTICLRTVAAKEASRHHKHRQKRPRDEAIGSNEPEAAKRRKTNL